MTAVGGMAIHIRRRELIAALGGAPVAWPLAARAQQPDRVRRIAVLLRVAQDDPDAQRDLQNFRKGLWQLGWTAGNNILIEYRYASADPVNLSDWKGVVERRGVRTTDLAWPVWSRL